MYHRNPASTQSPRTSGIIERLQRQLQAERRASADESARLRAALQQREASLRTVRAELRGTQEQLVLARRQATEAAAASSREEDTAEASALTEARRRLHRLAADLANLRRRQGEEQARARLEARSALLRSFVEILDGMERALAASTDTDSAWHQGSQALHRQMVLLLEREGIERLGAEGAAFDPRLHEAVGTAMDTAVPPDHIVAMVQAGYRFADGSLIRPARVVVASSPAG